MSVFSHRELSSPTERAKRLKYIRAQLLNFTRAQLCENANISMPSLKAWELALGNGLTEKGGKKIVAHLQTLGYYCSITWLLHGIGIAPAPESHALIHNDNEDAQITKELLLFRQQANSIDTLVENDRLQPGLRQGDIVAGIQTDNIPQNLGQLSIITCQSGQVLVGYLHQSQHPGSYEVDCGHPQRLLVDVANVAPIIWWRRRMQ